MANGKRPIRSEFTVHKLNATGFQTAEDIGVAFSEFLDTIESICGQTDGRDMALVKTNLQAASFYAKRVIAQQPVNQLVDS